MAEQPQPDIDPSLASEPGIRGTGTSATVLASREGTTAEGDPKRLEATVFAASGTHRFRIRPGSLLPEIPRERFEFLGTFAKGGVGRIVRAREPHLGRTVAVKELRQSDGESRERFVREVQLTARLQHPGIVPVYDAGCWPGGDPFFSMKLVSGKPFSRVIRRAQTIGQRLALLPHVLAVAEAIAYAHSQHIIHRDLKPQNILVGSFGETVVIDWGLAKDLAADTTDMTRSVSGDRREHSPQPVALQDSQISEEGLTLTGTVMGTPSYMPPEQAIGVSVDERADVYALGAILYHVLSGRAPYTGQNSVDVITKVTMGPPAPLHRIERKLPHELVTIVNKAMARNPDQRYRTAADFAEDLRRFQTGKIVGAHNYTTLQRLGRFVRRYRAPLISLTLLGLMGAVSVSEIIQERDLAERGRREAEAARVIANEQRRQANLHADQLVLEQARIAVKRDPSRVLTLLHELSPDFQAWSVARVIAADARAQGLPLVLRGHTATTTNVAFRSDDSTIFTASDDATIREWDLATGRQLRMLDGHTDEVWVLRMTPDDRYLLSAGKDKIPRLWDLQAGTSKELVGHKSEVFGASFLGDDRIMTLAYDETIRIWDMHSATEVASFEFYRPEERIFPLIDITDDARLYLRERRDGALEVVDTQTGETWSVKLPQAVANARFNHDGSKIAATTLSRHLHAFSRGDSGYQPLELPYDSTVSAMVFADDDLIVHDAAGARLVFLNLATGGKRQVPLTLERLNRLTPAAKGPSGERWIAAGTGSGVVFLVDALSGTTRALRKFQDNTLGIEFSHSGKSVAATSFDHTVRVWDVQTPSHQLLTQNQHPLVFARPLVDGVHLLTGDNSGMVYLHNLATREVRPMPGHSDPLSAVALDPATRRSATGDFAGTIYLWTDDGSGQRLPPLHRDRIRDLTFAGDLLISIGEDGQAIAWPRDDNPRVLTHEKRPLRALASSANGQTVAFGGRRRVVTIWQRDSDNTQTLAPFEGTVSALTLSDDGQMVAAGTLRHELRVVDLTNGHSIDIDAGGNGVRSICLSHDKRLVYVASLESAIRVWDTQTGEPVTSLRGHRGSVPHIALAPDGTRLVSVSQDQTLRLWSLMPSEPAPDGAVELQFESRELIGHMQAPVDAAFTADGRGVVSAGHDGSLRLWPDDLPQEPDEFRAWLEVAIGEAEAQ